MNELDRLIEDLENDVNESSKKLNTIVLEKNIVMFLEKQLKAKNLKTKLHMSSDGEINGEVDLLKLVNFKGLFDTLGFFLAGKIDSNEVGTIEMSYFSTGKAGNFDQDLFIIKFDLDGNIINATNQFGKKVKF